MESIISRCPHCQANNRLPLERLNEQPKCGKCGQGVIDGAPIEGTQANFSALINSTVPTVIDFWASWCNPCVGFAPVFSDAANQFKGQARFIKVDTEAQQALAAQYRIRSIPTVMVFRQGKLIETVNGALPASQFASWLNQQLSKA